MKSTTIPWLHARNQRFAGSTRLRSERIKVQPRCHDTNQYLLRRHPARVGLIGAFDSKAALAPATSETFKYNVFLRAVRRDGEL